MHLEVKENRTSVLLTGGASRRMGHDKSRLIVEGEPLGDRLARTLCEADWPPAVLGHAPIAGYAFQPDRNEFAGPAAALRAFYPPTGLVFVLSCDVVRFNGLVPLAFEMSLGSFDAVMPVIDGKLQPLCGLYQSRCWESLRNFETSRIMDWIQHLNVLALHENRLRELDIDPRWVQGVNTPEELNTLLSPDNPAI